jgi:hypothetical protein
VNQFGSEHRIQTEKKTFERRSYYSLFGAERIAIVCGDQSILKVTVGKEPNGGAICLAIK